MTAASEGKPSDEAPAEDWDRVLPFQLDALGVRDRTPFMEAEMLRLFGSLASTVPEGPDRERRLCTAIRSAMSEYD